MKNKAILGALAMDLKRAALGFHKGSDVMANRFFEEAFRRKDEIDVTDVAPYISKWLVSLNKIKSEEKQKAAEDALLYSTIFQNASQA